MTDSIRVLHVDDEPGLLELASLFIERSDDTLTVETVTDPTEVAERIREDGADIDCIVSDYDMPELDGLKLLKIVQDEHPSFPFILFTGKGSEEIASEAISLGVTDYMQKGVGTDQYEVLANRIRNAVEGQRAEADLERSESVFETLSRQDIVGIYVVQDEKFTFVNEKFAEVFGYDRSAVLGTAPYQYVAPADQDKVKTKITERLESKSESYHYMYQGQRKDGSTFPVEVHGGRTVLDGEQAIVGVLIECEH